VYEYIDNDKSLRKNTTYYYWLESVDIYGRPELYGPVSARLAQKTALLSFTATGAEESITLNWETASEINNTGFNLYRATAEDGKQTQLNAELVPTEPCTSTSTAMGP
jgi:hypothetical protein